MNQKLELLPEHLIQQIIDEALLVLRNTGVRVFSSTGRNLLEEAGAEVDEETSIARIPEHLAREALSSPPKSFQLYDVVGKPAVLYGGDSVHFDPGSSGVNILDSETLVHRPAKSPDLIRLIQVTEMLPQYDAQSTAVVCADVPKEIGDIYRLYLVLLHSGKPVVTGAFTTMTGRDMIDMLALVAGSYQALANKPRAVFDVCPSPPLTWTAFAADNLIDLAKAQVPAEIVSMPLAGVAAPVTLLGSVVQQTAETISGITIHQLARPGAPIVWGGAPAIFDMRQGTTPMGAMETAMLNACNAQIAKSFDLPTHGYLGASDAKIIDAQSGFESGMTFLVGALAGIDMISGAGMLDFLACQSPEKLVIDAETIGMVQRLLAGVQSRTKPLAIDMMAAMGFEAGYLKDRHTRQLFTIEQHLPSDVVDRMPLISWQSQGKTDTFERAKKRVKSLEEAHREPELAEELIEALHRMMTDIARGVGLDKLPTY